MGGRGATGRAGGDMRFRLQLRADKRAPGEARRVLERRVESRLRDDERETVRLLVSELVANGVRHAAGDEPLTLVVALDADRLRVEVHDRGAGFEPGVPTPRGAEGGYGLFLVDRLASRWGV